MTTWTTSEITPDDSNVSGFGTLYVEWYRFEGPFSSEIPVGVYVSRIQGGFSISLDADSQIGVSVRAGISGTNDDQNLGSLSPGATRYFSVDQLIDPAKGPIGHTDRVYSIYLDNPGGPWISAEIGNVVLQYKLSDSPPGPDPEGATAYNCACDDDYPRTTLAQMRNRLATRLGFATQVAMGMLPPGMPELLDDFIRNAQEMLYRRYAVFRMERFYVWDMEPGVRFYDFDANADGCPKRMDPRMVSWAGVSQGDLSWRPLVCGIDPVMYGSPGPGIPSHYEIRQCIEVWPAPVDDTWKLRIKGHFGLLPLEADSDETTIDPEAIFLQALANAKAHYGQADAGNYAAQATAYVRSLVAGSHHTRRYIPGSAIPPPAVRPVLKED